MPLIKQDNWIGLIAKIIFGIIAGVFIIGANLLFISGAYSKAVRYRSANSDEEKEPLGDVIVLAIGALFFLSVTLVLIVMMILDIMEKLK